MQELFNKFDLNVQVEKAKGDSFKVDKEAVNKAIELKAGLIIITASRDYGLDDILFGPREQHLIRKSSIPLLIVNPRADLYALCD
jgi:nucleotide-binding universal stress UspA family protein